MQPTCEKETRVASSAYRAAETHARPAASRLFCPDGRAIRRFLSESADKPALTQAKEVEGRQGLWPNHDMTRWWSDPGRLPSFFDLTAAGSRELEFNGPSTYSAI